MLTPPPVSGQSFPTSSTSEERSNYLRGGMAFTSAYTDNALGSVNGHPVSDVSYSVAPFIALDETTPRLHVASTYAPGFTFYQRESSLNETDQNASINFQYRLSPHVTFSARDGFQKSSNVFNQPDLASAGAVSGGAQEANFSVIAPIADRLSNTGNVGITSQFAANGMVGASGTFTNLHYPDQAEVPGLFDSSSQAGSVFLLAPGFEDALHWRDLRVPATAVVPDRGHRTRPRLTLFFCFTRFIRRQGSPFPFSEVRNTRIQSSLRYRHCRFNYLRRGHGPLRPELA